MDFADWVKQRRIGLGLSQPALAQEANCSPDAIRKIEQRRRNPSKQMVSLLASALRLPPAQRPAFVAWAIDRPTEAAPRELLSLVAGPNSVAPPPPPLNPDPIMAAVPA